MCNDMLGLSLAHRYLSQPAKTGEPDTRPSRILLSGDGKNFVVGRRVLEEEFIGEVALESGDDTRKFINSAERVTRTMAAKQFGVVML
mmetsp:Transcript_38041/g.98222  ORF Transcript_38041/g.98222 Transcript_38041/m.98222 type:complete len:88 (+) Transcript_38041:1575-1838(+)